MGKSFILLAAGKSSRFWPLNYRHKTMIKLVGKTIIEHVLDELKSINPKEIIIVTSPRDKADFEKIRKRYTDLEINIGVQDEPRGMWEAILIGSKKSSYDQFIVMNAHQLGVLPVIKKLENVIDKSAATLTVTRTDKPELFGIVEIKNSKIRNVVEKPHRDEAPSDKRIVGVYHFSKEFLDFLEAVSGEEESEYKLEYALAKYARERGLDFIEIDYDPLSLRFPWDLFEFKKYLFSKMITNKKVSMDAKVSKWAHIEGPVIIESEARIFRHTVVKGPTYIGENVIVGDNTIVRESDLENDVKVGALFEIARSIMQPYSTSHSGYIGDSVIGENTKIGAGFITANVRLDRENIKVFVKGKKVDSGLRKLGVMIGRNTNIGIHVGTMPGRLIGSNALVGPGKMVFENVPDEGILL